MASEIMSRADFVTFVNTGTTEAPVWKLVGDGVTTATVNMNPQTEEKTYIHQRSGTTVLESYRPSFPLEFECVPGDDAYDFIEPFYLERRVLAAAHAEILNVYLHREVGTDTGIFKAERQPVTIQVDDFGGEGGASNKLNVTFSYRGDPTIGEFDTADNSFAEPASP